MNREARADRRSVEVVTDSGGRLTVFGSNCAELGETAFRHHILVHQLADETGDTGPAPPVVPVQASEVRRTTAEPGTGPLSPPLPARPVRSPLRPFRYELRRFLGVRTPWLVAAAVLVASVALTLPLARTGNTPLPGLLAAWPSFLPLPPAALGAGLLGAFAFGDEYRYPALAADGARFRAASACCWPNSPSPARRPCCSPPSPSSSTRGP